MKHTLQSFDIRNCGITDELFNNRNVRAHIYNYLEIPIAYDIMAVQ